MSAPRQVAVLLGGGIESTLLVRQLLLEGARVQPVHIHCGLLWDDCEAAHVRQFCQAHAGPSLAELTEIRLPLADFLGEHWAVTGRGIPQRGDDSGQLEIPLRNLTLLGFALSRLKQTDISEFALGTTADNHYPDGSRGYFDHCERLLSIEAGRPIRVVTPLIGLDKSAVLRLCDRETLSLSFSCVSPRDGGHCGECIKCGRRQAAFLAAQIADPTVYARPALRVSL